MHPIVVDDLRLYFYFHDIALEVMKNAVHHVHTFFFEGGWLVTQMLMLAYGGGTPNAYFCKQGYLVGQKWSKKCLRNLRTAPKGNLIVK